MRVKLSQRTRDRLSTAAVVAGVAIFTGLVAWGLTETKPAPAAPTPVVVTTTQAVPTTVTATLAETATVIETPAPVTETVTVEVPSTTTEVVEVPVTVTETVTVTEEAAMAAPEPSAGGSCDLPGGWYFVPGLEAQTGMWARTAFDGSHVQVDPDLPPSMCGYMIAHETGHVLQAQAFGSIPRTPGNYERVADCYASLAGWRGSLVYGCDEASMTIAREMLGGG